MSTPPHSTGHDPTSASQASLAWFYFVALSPGFLWTMTPRYLEGLGWLGAEVGALFASRKAAELLTMGLWATWADRTGRPRPLIQLQYALGAAALIAFSTASAKQATGATWASMILYGVAMGCAHPLLDALVLHHVGAQRYSAVRAWGSAGFGLMALSIALLSTDTSYAQLVSIVPIVIAACATLAALFTALLPDARARATAPSLGAARELLERPILGWLFALGLLHWSTQTPYNMIFVELCEDNKLGTWVPGAATVAGVLTEILVLRHTGWLMQHATPQAWLVAAIAISAVRWLVIGHITSEPLMIALQLTHGLSFGAFLAACIHLLAAHVPDHLRATGQATFYFAVFGLGTILGQLVTGAASDALGAARTFAAAGLTEAILCLVGIWFWHRTTRQR